MKTYKITYYDGSKNASEETMADSEIKAKTNVVARKFTKDGYFYFEGKRYYNKNVAISEFMASSNVKIEEK